MHSLSDADYEHITDDLAHRYSDVIDWDRVNLIVGQVRAELEPDARHPEFLGALVAKQARDRVVAAVRDAGRAVHVVPEVLFVCRHNAGRSQMAAAFAEHLGGGHVHVRAAGEQPGAARNELVEAAMHERGLDFTHDFESGVTGDLLHRADVIVQMGAAVPDLPGAQVISWDIPDPHEQPIEQVRLIRDQIEHRVRGLLRDLGVAGPGQAGSGSGSGTGDPAAGSGVSSGSGQPGRRWPEAHRGSLRA